MSKSAGFLVVAAILSVAAAPLAAQPVPGQDVQGRPQLGGTYNVRTMSFDLWCQDTRRYPIERCDERRRADVEEFENYRATIERYELQFLKQQDEEQELNARIMRDPSSTVRSKENTPLR